MHTKGIVNGKTILANGDFTEGFKIVDGAKDSETGWFDLYKFFPMIKQAVKTGNFKETTIEDRENNRYTLSVTECEIIVRSYLDEVFGHITGLTAKDQILLLKDNKLADLLKVPLTKGQIKDLEKAGIK